MFLRPGVGHLAPALKQCIQPSMASGTCMCMCVCMCMVGWLVCGDTIQASLHLLLTRTEPLAGSGPSAALPRAASAAIAVARLHSPPHPRPQVQLILEDGAVFVSPLAPVSSIQKEKALTHSHTHALTHTHSHTHTHTHTHTLTLTHSLTHTHSHTHAF